MDEPNSQNFTGDVNEFNEDNNIRSIRLTYRSIYIAGDFDSNGEVDFGDFAIFALTWLSQDGDPNYNSICDISIPADSFIDELDLSIIVNNWLEGK